MSCFCTTPAFRFAMMFRMSKKKYTASDGDLTLVLQEIEDGWLLVRSPTDPAMITQARSLKEAFVMARDAFACLAEARKDRDRWKRPAARKPAARKFVNA